jgi:hypothetical protein
MKDTKGYSLERINSKIVVVDVRVSSNIQVGVKGASEEGGVKTKGFGPPSLFGVGL